MAERDTSFKMSYAIALASQLGFLVATSIGGFIVLGVWLDRKWGTEPWLLLLGVVVGIVMTIYEIRHLVLPLMLSDANKKHDPD